MSNKSQTPPAEALERLLRMGVPEHLVTELTATISSMQQASCKGEVNIEPALQDLLTKLSMDANTFLDSLNVFYQAIAESSACPVKQIQSPGYRLKEVEECCSCTSTYSEELDCESLDYECVCETESSHATAPPKESSYVTPTDSLGMNCEVCILEEELTEVSTYSIDPITKKVKISKVEEFSQITKCTSLQNRSMQTCECSDGENIKSDGEWDGEGDGKNIAQSKPLVRKARLPEEYDTETIPELSEPESLPDESETEPLSVASGIEPVSVESEIEDDVSVEDEIEFLPGQFKVEPVKAPVNKSAELQKRKVPGQSSSTPLETIIEQQQSATSDQMRSPYASKQSSRGNRSSSHSAAGFATDQEESFFSTKQRIEEAQPKDNRKIKEEQRGAVTCICRTTQTEPISINQDTQTGKNRQCVDACCSCSPTTKKQDQFSVATQEREEGIEQEQSSIPKPEREEEGKGDPDSDSATSCTASTCSAFIEGQLGSSPKRRPCRDSTCSVLSQVPSSKIKRDNQGSQLDSSYADYAIDEKQSSVTNRSPCRDSTCSVLSQVPSSKIKRDNQGSQFDSSYADDAIDVKQSSVTNRSPCRDSTCFILSQKPSSKTNRGNQERQFDSPYADDVMDVKQSTLTNRSSPWGTPCRNSNCSLLSQAPSSKGKRDNKERQFDSPYIDDANDEKQSSVTNRSPCRDSTCSILSQKPSSRSKREYETDHPSVKQGNEDGECVDVCCSCPSKTSQREQAFATERGGNAGPGSPSITSCTASTCSAFNQLLSSDIKGGESVPKRRPCTDATCSVVTQVSASLGKQESREKRPNASPTGPITEEEQSYSSKQRTKEGQCVQVCCGCQTDSKIPIVSKRGSTERASSPSADSLNKQQQRPLSNQPSPNSSILSPAPSSYNKQRSIGGLPSVQSAGTTNEPVLSSATTQLSSQRQPCTRSTCSILSQAPSTRGKQESREKLPVSSPTGSIAEPELHMAFKSGSEERPSSPSGGSLNKQERSSLSNRSSPRKRPSTLSRSSVPSQAPSLHDKQASKEGLSSLHSAGITTEQKSFSPTTPLSSGRTPCTRSTCSILSQVPTSRSKQEGSQTPPHLSPAGSIIEQKPPGSREQRINEGTGSIVSKRKSKERPGSPSGGSFNQQERASLANRSSPTKPPCSPSTCSVLSQVPSKQKRPDGSPIGSIMQQQSGSTKEGIKDGQCVGLCCKCPAEQKSSFVSKRGSKERPSSPTSSLMKQEKPSLSNRLSPTKPPSTHSKRESKEGRPVSSPASSVNQPGQFHATEQTSNAEDEATEEEEVSSSKEILNSPSVGSLNKQEQASLANRSSPSKQPCSPSTCSVLSQVPSSYSKQENKEEVLDLHSAGAAIEQESFSPIKPLRSARPPCTLSTCSVISQVPRAKQESEKQQLDSAPNDSAIEEGQPASTKQKGKEDQCGYNCCGCHLALVELHSINQYLESKLQSYSSEYGPCTTSASSMLSQVPSFRSKRESKGGQSRSCSRSGSKIRRKSSNSNKLKLSKESVTQHKSKDKRSSLRSPSGTSKLELARPFPDSVLTTHSSNEGRRNSSSPPVIKRESSSQNKPGSKDEKCAFSCCRCVNTQTVKALNKEEQTLSSTPSRAEPSNVITSKQGSIAQSKEVLYSPSEAERSSKEVAAFTDSANESEPISDVATDYETETKQPSIEEAASPYLSDSTNVIEPVTTELVTSPETNYEDRGDRSSLISPTASKNEAASDSRRTSVEEQPAPRYSSDSKRTSREEGRSLESVKPPEGKRKSKAEEGSLRAVTPADGKRKSKEERRGSEPATPADGKRKSREERRGSEPATPAEGKRTSRGRGSTSKTKSKSRDDGEPKRSSKEEALSTEVTPTASKNETVSDNRRKSVDDRPVSPYPGDSKRRSSDERRGSAPVISTEGKRRSKGRVSSLSAPTSETKPKGRERTGSPYSTDSTNEPEFISEKRRKSKDARSISASSPGSDAKRRSTASTVAARGSTAKPEPISPQPDGLSPSLEMPPEDPYPEMSLNELFEKQRQKLNVDECVCTPTPVIEDKGVCTCPTEELPRGQLDSRAKKWVERLTATEQNLAALRAKIESFSDYPDVNGCTDSCGVHSPHPPQIRTRPEMPCCPVPAFMTVVGCDVPCNYPDPRYNKQRRSSSPTKPAPHNRPSMNIRITSNRSPSPSIPAKKIPLMPPQAIAIQPGVMDKYPRFDYNRQKRSKPRSSKIDYCSCPPE